MKLIVKEKMENIVISILKNLGIKIPMLKFLNFLKLTFKEKIVQPYNSDDDLNNLYHDVSIQNLRLTKPKNRNELLKNLAGLRGITAIDVMVPRVDIVTVSLPDNFNDIINQLTKANHSSTSNW